MEVGRFSPRNPTKRRIVCAVPGCRSCYNKDLTLRFHSFPEENKQAVRVKNIFGNFEMIDRCYAWKKILHITKVTPSTQVCSLHFLKSDYIFPSKSVYY